MSYSLNLLPHDLLISIFIVCASSSLSTYLNLRLVSKIFCKLCDQSHVLSKLSLEELKFDTNKLYPFQFMERYQKLRDIGHPEALYRLGIIWLFHCDEKEGLKLLHEASKKGITDAKYVYGVTLLCIGGTSKIKGAKLLSSFIKTTLKETYDDLDRVYDRVSPHLKTLSPVIFWTLMYSYVKDNCSCMDEDSKDLEDEDITTDMVCRSCLWDYEVQRLMERYHMMY